jgi:hypothetical protein
MPQRRSSVKKTEATEKNGMVEPLTNVILASILHLIQRDLAGNGRFPIRKTPCQVPAHRRCRRPRRSGPRGATPPPQYQPMEPSPPNALEQSLPRSPLPPFGVPYTQDLKSILGGWSGHQGVPLHSSWPDW